MKRIYKNTFAALWLITISLTAQSQIQLSYTGTPTISGNEGAIGTIYTWNNVGKTGKVTIKSEVEIIAITGGASLENIDNAGSGSDDAWQPIINGSQTDGSCWGIEFNIRFYDAKKNTELTLSSFVASGVDIDGNNGTLREYNSFSNPSSYIVESNSYLTTSIADGFHTFISPQSQHSGISLTETNYIISAEYENKQNFSVILGSCCVGGNCSGSNGNRLHSINMFDAIAFVGPKSLPVSLLNFDAVVSDNKTVVLDWSTAAEINNDYFTIERSTNGIDWEVMDIVSGAGNSQNVLTYSTTDYNPLPGKSFYRLKQNDFNGKFEYFQIEMVDMDALGHVETLIFPNPSAGPISIELMSTYNYPSSVRVISLSGQVVMQEVEMTNKIMVLDISILPTGMYTVEVIQGQKMSRTKFVKQ